MIRYVDAASSTGGPDRGLSDFFAALARQICNLSAAYRSAYQLKDGTFGSSQTAKCDGVVPQLDGQCHEAYRRLGASVLPCKAWQPYAVRTM